MDEMDKKILFNFYDQGIVYLKMLGNKNIISRVLDQHNTGELIKNISENHKDLTNKEISLLLIVLNGIGLLLSGMDINIELASIKFVAILDMYEEKREDIFDRLRNEGDEIMKKYYDKKLALKTE